MIPPTIFKISKMIFNSWIYVYNRLQPDTNIYNRNINWLYVYILCYVISMGMLSFDVLLGDEEVESCFCLGITKI